MKGLPLFRVEIEEIALVMMVMVMLAEVHVWEIIWVKAQYRNEEKQQQLDRTCYSVSYVILHAVENLPR